MLLEHKELLENNPISIATTDGEQPNIAVAAYARVVGDKLLITDNYMSKTVQNLTDNSSVAIAAFDKNWQGVKVIGKAEYVANGKYYDFVKNMPENKGESVKGVIIVTPKDVYGIG
jgi:uncharacterized pyridoxamine 5'-phosphate oxidase family protein